MNSYNIFINNITNFLNFKFSRNQHGLISMMSKQRNSKTIIRKYKFYSIVKIKQ